MAAWGKAGSSSWADDADKGDGDISDLPVVDAPPLKKEDDRAFPSLGAAKQPQSRKEKKKGKTQTLTLAEFATGVYKGPSSRNRSSAIVNDQKGLTTHEMALLPTGPRERAEDEEDEPGGFRGFRGGDRFGDKGKDRDDRGRREDMQMPSREEESASWGQDRKFVPTGDQGRGGGFRERSTGGFGDADRGERDGPSKADEANDWGAGKKFTPSSSSSSFAAAPGSSTWGRGGGGFEDGGRRGFDERPPPPAASRADEVDNWGSVKKFAPSSAPPARAGGGGEGDRWARRDAPSGEGQDAGQWSKKEPLPVPVPSAADTTDRWAKRPESTTTPAPSERPRLVLQKRTVPPADSAPAASADAASADAGADGAKPRKPDPFGGAKPREAVLAVKGVKPGDLERTSSSGSAASSSSASQTDKEKTGDLANGGAPKAPRPNPFGAAKPREVLLEEKGIDWRKADASLDRKAAPAKPESADQKQLKEEIATLAAKLEGTKVAGERPGEGEAAKEGEAAQENGLDEDAKKEIQKQIDEKKAKLEALDKSMETKGAPAGAAKTPWRRSEAAAPKPDAKTPEAAKEEMKAVAAEAAT